jgi:hypothetical protein
MKEGEMDRTTSTKKKLHRRAHVTPVVVGVQVLETRLDVALAQGLGPDQRAAADGVRRLLRKAEEAAYGDDPKVGPVARWWRGTLVEVSFQNLHAARAQMVDVYADEEVAAEIPAALARSQQALHADDPRRLAGETLTRMPPGQQRAFLRRAIEDSYDAMDRQHERLRSFRNIILIAALCIGVLVTATILVVHANPTYIPLCFAANGESIEGVRFNCPTGTGVLTNHGSDIVVVALLGLLGGALAAAVSIRNLRGTSTPYDVPVALALLKVPLGAFTAIVGLVALQGSFVPGLSALDSQQQILAYALVLGYAQQVFTYSLDRRAQSLLDGLPSKDPTVAPSRVDAQPVVPAHDPGPGPGDGFVDVPTQGPPPPAEEIDLRDDPAVLPPPPDADDLAQDDDSRPMPNVPVGDHR